MAEAVDKEGVVIDPSKVVEPIDQELLGKLIARAAGACGLSRTVMMALTVLIHNLGVGRVNTFNLERVRNLCRMAGNSLRGLEERIVWHLADIAEKQADKGSTGGGE